LLLLAGVVLIAIAAGTTVWLVRPSFTPPTPPPVPLEEGELVVTAFIEKSRERVLNEPRSGQAWGALGQAFIANDMEDESRVCFIEAERLDPNDPRWPYYLAGTFLNRGDREAALPCLRRAVERCAVAEADNLVPQLLLAETLLALGRLDEAEEHFRQVLARQADDPRAHFGMALACSARQDWQTSRSHLLRCLGSPSARQKATVQLAVVSQRLDDQAGAEKYRLQAYRLPKDDEWSDPFVMEYLLKAVKKKNRYRLAESLEGAGRLKEAAAALQPMLEEYPNDYLPRLSLGKVYGQLGEHRRAAMILREALRLAPEKVQIHYYLSLVLFGEAEDLARKGDGGRAEKLYREAAQRARETLTIKPDYGFAFMTLGLSLKRLGQSADALASLRQAVRCNPEHAELHFYLGEMLAEADQRSEAKHQLEQAVRMAPLNVPWRQTALARLGAIEQAANPMNAPRKPGQ
jgi:tetratricopeptide (TPR) repeat protein